MIDILKALADENRMRILNLLFEKELCVCELETVLGISQSNASRHLLKLKQVKIISSSKDAQWVHYKASDEFIAQHASLVEYLKTNMAQTTLFLEDSRKLNKYFELGLSCTDIRNDAEHVVQLIGR